MRRRRGNNRRVASNSRDTNTSGKLAIAAETEQWRIKDNLRELQIFYMIALW
jgi:hypothetical protein